MPMIRRSIQWFVVLCVIFLPAVVHAQDESPQNMIEYIVTTATANLRSGPGTAFGISGTVTQGESILVYNETPEVSGWLRIQRLGEDDAYIADFLVEQAPMRFYPIDQEPIIAVSGRGKNISEVFDIPKGAYRIDASVQDRAFILHAVAVDAGCRDQSIFNELDLNANRLNISALLISNGCSYIFETDNVSGTWEFAVRDVLDLEVIAEMLYPIENGSSLSGTGRTLTMVTSLPEGVWTINGVVEDQAFILHAHVLSGDCRDSSVFNELDFDVQVLEVQTVYRSDNCMIFWETNNTEGDWTLTFSKIR